MKPLSTFIAALLLSFSLSSLATAENGETIAQAQETNRTQPRHAPPALNNENSRLKADIIRLETQVQALEQENLLLRDRRARDWFISGTGVILMGFFIGFLAHKIQIQRKSSW